MGAVDEALALAKSLGGNKKAKAPEPEAKAPEPEAKAPEPEVKAPEPEAKDPEPEVKTPEPEVKTPEPEAKDPEPEAKKKPALTGFAKKRARHPDLIACKVKGTVPVRGIARFEGESVLVTQAEFDRYAKKLKKIG